MENRMRRMLRSKAVREYCGGWSEATLWRKVRKGFPKPLYRNGVRYWDADEVAAFWGSDKNRGGDHELAS